MKELVLGSSCFLLALFFPQMHAILFLFIAASSACFAWSAVAACLLICHIMLVFVLLFLFRWSACWWAVVSHHTSTWFCSYHMLSPTGHVYGYFRAFWLLLVIDTLMSFAWLRLLLLVKGICLVKALSSNAWSPPVARCAGCSCYRSSSLLLHLTTGVVLSWLFSTVIGPNQAMNIIVQIVFYLGWELTARVFIWKNSAPLYCFWKGLNTRRK